MGDHFDSPLTTNAVHERVSQEIGSALSYLNVHHLNEDISCYLKFVPNSSCLFKSCSLGNVYINILRLPFRKDIEMWCENNLVYLVGKWWNIRTYIQKGVHEYTRVALMVHARVSLQSRQKYAAKRTICYFQVDQEQPILPPPPTPLILVSYGWGFAPAFLTSPALSNEGREETLGQKKKNSCFGHNIIAMIVDQFQRVKWCERIGRRIKF